MSEETRTDELGHLGRYELLARLASGGMGEIFLARLAGEGGFEKLVVIKRLLDELGDSETFVAMFRDEARIAARLSHPNVCEVYELGQDAGRYYIAMQYLEGVPYGRLMEPGADAVQHARLVAGLLTQACEGLHHAHEARGADGELLGVVHRDVSPSNLFVTTTGVVKVLDFGIAKARGASARTTRGTIKGTYQYMSPEQVRGDPLDRRSDLFALGIVLHESLTGRRLFDRSSDYLIAKAIIEEPVPRVGERRPGLPAALDEVVARALARKPEQRFATARELGRALTDAVAELGGPLAVTDIAEVLEDQHGHDLRTQRQRYREATGAGQPTAGGTVPFAAPAAAREQTTRSLGPPPVPRQGRTRRLAIGALAIAAVSVVAVLVTGALREADSRAASPHPAPPPHAGEGYPRQQPGTSEHPTGNEPAAAATGNEPAAEATGDELAAEATGNEPAAEATGDELAAAASDDERGAGVAEVGGSPSPPPLEGEGSPSQPAPREGEGAKERPPDRTPTAPQRSPEAVPGYLSIDSSPYATIYIDGRRAGVTPMIRRELAPGRHSVRAVLENGRSQQFTVSIEPGQAAPPQKLSW